MSTPGPHENNGPPPLVQDVLIQGVGAVSPAGWNAGELQNALDQNTPIPSSQLERPGWPDPIMVRSTPKLETRPECLRHPRLRRSSPITQFALTAAMEALGSDLESAQSGTLKLGVILCTMSGSVNYSRRFYDEVLQDPATASPVIFPETVFNAPASHLASFFGGTTLDYTLVGDTATFLQGLALGAGWLQECLVEGCLVIGAEEKDWLTADALSLFHLDLITSEGAGALYLKSQSQSQSQSQSEAGIRLESITNAELFTNRKSRMDACHKMRRQLPAGEAGDLLCDTAAGIQKLDEAEQLAWNDWPGSRCSPKRILGEALVACTAWQCVAATQWLQKHPASCAVVSAVGHAQHAVGAHLSRSNHPFLA